MRFHIFKVLHNKTCCKFTLDAAHKHIFNLIHHYKSNALICFENQITCKAVTNYDITHSVRNIPAFYISDEIQVAVLKKFMRISVKFCSLVFFCTDIGKSDTGVFDTHNLFHIY